MIILSSLYCCHIKYVLFGSLCMHMHIYVFHINRKLWLYTFHFCPFFSCSDNGLVICFVMYCVEASLFGFWSWMWDLVKFIHIQFLLLFSIPSSSSSSQVSYVFHNFFSCIFMSFILKLRFHRLKKKHSIFYFLSLPHLI